MTAIAIDFGTSNTVVSILEPDTNAPKTLRFAQISRLFKMPGETGEILDVPVIPSLVYIQGKGEVIIGEQVRSQRLGLSQPARFFKGFKRDLVADFPSPPRAIDGVNYQARSISERFLQTLWENIQKLEIEPSELIFTVPVGSFERYLDWFRDWGEKMGADRVRFVDESTAAALGYAVENLGSLVLVVDFGGGTLDLSLVRMETPDGKKDIFKAKVLAKSDAYLGGEDIDIWIVEDYLRQMGSDRESLSEVGWQNLLEISEVLKIQLSKTEQASESWLDEETFMSYDLSLNRDRLEDILERNQLLEQLREALDEVLSVALGKGVKKSEIAQILLVGGSCLIPAVQNLIVSYFGRSRVKLGKPFDAVCHGALALTKVSEIEDYLHHNYVIRLVDPSTETYFYHPLFDRGSTYPCKLEESITLQVAENGQKEIRLDVGELAELTRSEIVYNEAGVISSRKLSKQTEYRSLETHHQEVCIAHLEPPGQLKQNRISVWFEVNENRVLLATVIDLLTDKILMERGAIAKLK
ncbi:MULTISPECIES: Hsp70 family protein [Spirulina sp. CCY15215]|uniref:Hsp70 family protein n=1 Tax=Spirulina sp. CCY15215 TaxID=2767591 RepID=UPI0019508330|nr:Hsp70 family protein [Spirulina major]